MRKRDINSFKKRFGENLQKIRENKNLSLLQVSYRCNIDNSKISKIEHGKFDIRLSTIIELCRGLDIKPRELFSFDFDISED